MRLLRVPLTLILAAAACSSPLDSGEALGLAKARAQWEERPFADYTFDLRRVSPEVQVGPVRHNAPRSDCQRNACGHRRAIDPAVWFTIEQLFDFIPHSATGDGVDDVTIEYDPSLGFPSVIEVRTEDSDTGDTFTITNVGPA